MEAVTGYVDHIVFRNEENGYTVFNLENDDGELTCVGSFNFISEGELLELQGDYVNHNVYGSQFKVSSYRIKEPKIWYPSSVISDQERSREWALLLPQGS